MSQPLTRSGNVGSPPEHLQRWTTPTTDLDQTPLNSPTVFNFFLPDYKFPGTLASQGITTPEFQMTAETTVVRQANFLYNGVFNPGNTNGISSFKTGSNALVMDFSPWMGNAATNLGLGAPGRHRDRAVDAAMRTSSTLIDQHEHPAARPASCPPTAKTDHPELRRPCTITSIAHRRTRAPSPRPRPHGLTTGDSVTISGVTGGTFSRRRSNGTYDHSHGHRDRPEHLHRHRLNCTAAPTATA